MTCFWQLQEQNRPRQSIEPSHPKHPRQLIEFGEFTHPRQPWELGEPKQPRQLVEPSDSRHLRLSDPKTEMTKNDLYVFNQSVSLKITARTHSIKTYGRIRFILDIIQDTRM